MGEQVLETIILVVILVVMVGIYGFFIIHVFNKNNENPECSDELRIRTNVTFSIPHHAKNHSCNVEECYYYACPWEG